ncbi:DUF5995 family protein [Streptomyces sp. WAC05374]|uniref:DUF5995 family protein n=1 Tax=Streptomyces sp. WAC05374 TaxID=2487420 RepID=UPI003FCE3FB6
MRSARCGRRRTGWRSSTASTSPSRRRSTGASARASSPTGGPPPPRAAPPPRAPPGRGGAAGRGGGGGSAAGGPAAARAVRSAGRSRAAVAAVAGGGRPPACWRPLFQYRRHPGVRPLQFALAGINAHIGHDLALAVVDTCRTLNCEPADVEGEFDRVGDILTLLEERIREELMPGPDLLEVADPLTHLLGCWSLERARDGAWLAARSLWQLHHLGGRFPELAEEFTERLDRSVGLVGRMLLTPLPVGAQSSGSSTGAISS